MEKQQINISKRKDSLLISIFIAIIFLIILDFFTLEHPIVICDIDDWEYSSAVRSAIPLWGNWNPIRVFPEVFMPLITKISIVLFYNVFGIKLFKSISIGYAITIAIVFSVLIYQIYKYLRNKNLPTFDCIIVLTYFIISHFLIKKIKTNDNLYMLYGEDACIYFYYVIQQMIEADKSTQENAIIEIPYFNDGGNWPYSFKPGYVISNFCSRYGITKNKIDVTLNPSKDIDSYR